MDNHSKNFWLIIVYKLLFDLLFLLLLVLTGLLVAEALLPSFLSGHLSFTKIILFVFGDLVLIGYLDKKINVAFFTQTQKKPRKIAFVGLFVFLVLLFAASLVKFFWLNVLAIILATLAIIYLFYKNILVK